MKKYVSMFLTVLLFFNLSDVSNVKANSLNVLQNKTALTQSLYSGQRKGYIRPNIKITKNASNSNYLKKSTNLPSSYDLRTQGYLTSVKSQGNIGDCWAFSSIGSLESCLIKSRNQKKDFSEINLAVNSGFNKGADDGGNSLMTTAYFARWGGPVSENEDPYPDPADVSDIVQRSGLKPDEHVQDVIFLPDRTSFMDNTEIKSAVMNYGAVATTIYMDESSYLNWNNSAYYSDSSNYQNHGIDIVGWNDSYSRTNFLNTPPGDGAFICKNSWGSNFGDNGYFYVSYYDTGIGYDNYIFDNAEPVNNYSEIYQYTPLGMGCSISYGNTNWFANVYTASDEGANKQSLAAVSFYTYEEGTSYEVYVEPDYGSYGFSRILSNKLKTGTFSYAGYHTVKMDNLESLTNGKKYAVAVKITNPDSCYIVTEDTNFKDTSTVISLAGQSFINTSSDGNSSSWEDVGVGNPNVCLNAFTKITYSVPVNGISLNNSVLSMNSGDTSTLTAYISPANAVDKNVIFESSNDYVATVDSTGKVTAKNTGYAVITAMSEDGSYKAECTIDVKGNVTYNLISPTQNTDVDVNGNIIMSFSDNIKSGTDYNNIILVDEYGDNIAKSLTINNSILTIKPDAALSQGKMYILKFPKNAVTDYAGNTIANDVKYSFLTRIPYNNNVTFESPYLESEIRNQLNMPAGRITSDNMKKITSISMSQKNIEGLKGLEYAVNLNYLSMDNCNIEDISPLEHLVNLNQISLQENKIRDISPISHLYNLKDVYFDNNYIEDCSPLTDMINIEDLEFGDNNISNITPLKSMVMNQMNSQKYVVSSLSLDFNYLNTSDSDTSTSISFLSGKVNSFNINYQKIGLKKEYASPDDIFIDKSTAPVVISFENTIYSSTALNDIQFYDDNFQHVAYSISVNNNKLILRPKQKLNPGINYYIDIPQNAVKDSAGLCNDECYYSFLADNNNCDINSDGTTDIKDIAALGQSYGSKVTGTNFSSAVDFNKDGIIDLYDLVTIARLLKQ